MEHIWTNILDQLTYHPQQPMMFSSGVFWCLFMVFIPIYAMLRSRLWQMVSFVVLFSFFFYYKSSGFFVFLLGATSLIDWTLSRILVKQKRRSVRKLCVWVSIVCSLSILAYFKYANFFLVNWNAITGSNFGPLEIILPVGISFYTFQSISYIVDVYKGRVAPTKTWLEYCFFLSFFPALVAGPIVRADYFLPQIRQSNHATRNEIYLGLWLIILGVIKKAIIADYIAQYNDLIFTMDEATGLPGYSGFETMMGIIGYTMQIYCDFSGYSDMAIGIALIMGFKLAQNFNFPYKSTNLTEFWRRWHISLSSWLRDYVYIPLGGNRKGTARTYLNNFLTMLIGGLWHGAAWKFVFWGGMHGAGLAVHKASKPWLERHKWTDAWPMKIVFWTVTMAFVAALWVFFRADSWADSWAILSHAVTDFSWDYAEPFLAVRWLWLILLGVIVIAHALPDGFWNKVGDLFIRSPWLVKLLVFVVVVQCVIELQGEDVAPFIYFNSKNMTTDKDIAAAGPKVMYHTFGCKLNFAETSTPRRDYEAAGYVTVHDGDTTSVPDVVVINSCSVTEVADRKCRQYIRSVNRRYPEASIVVTGCYAQLKADEIAALPGVRIVAGTDRKGRLVEMTRAITESSHVYVTPTPEITEFTPSCARGDRTRFFLKVQDGCNYRCSYCTIPKARGRSRWAPVADIVEQARRAAEAGGREIVITGVNIGDYGRGGEESFLDLLKALDGVDGIERYRISSIEPNLITDEIIEWCAGSRAFMPHFHIPLQSGSDTVLGLMRRRYRTELFAHRVETIRRVMPDAFIGVDLIAGSRGETPELFAESKAFVESLDISRLHVFAYSERPGTDALNIPYRVDPREQTRRVHEMLAVSDAKLRSFSERFIGTVRPALLEHPHADRPMGGFTDNYLRVIVDAPASLDNTVVNVRLDRLDDNAEAVHATLI